MGKEELIKLIDECRTGFLEIGENFSGPQRIDANKKEEEFYRTKFSDEGIVPGIVSHIHYHRNSNLGIEEIKQNLKTYRIK